MILAKRTRGSAGKYLLLILLIGALIGFFYWKNAHGVVGVTPVLPINTVDRIAYIRQSGGQTEIVTIKADGTDLQPMTSDGHAKRAPAWSPDGRQICYVADPATSGAEAHAFQVFIVGAGDPRQITMGSQSKDNPQWSSDGRQIAFLSTGAIKVIEPNGSNLKQIYPPPHAGSVGENGDTKDEDDAGQLPPIDSFVWSPNSVPMVARIVMEGEYINPSGRGDWWKKSDGATRKGAETMEAEQVLLLPHLDLDKPLPLSNANANKVGFAWFPDSDRLVVSLSSSKGEHGLALYHVKDPHGAPDLLFVSAGYTIAPENPEVSPDGSQIAFEAWRMDGPENRELLGIAVVSSSPSDTLTIKTKEDLSKLKILVQGEASRPHWSPDGTRLLYSMPGQTGRDLWVCKTDGSGAVNLTKGQGDSFDASWSPAKH